MSFFINPALPREEYGFIDKISEEFYSYFQELNVLKSENNNELIIEKIAIYEEKLTNSLLDESFKEFNYSLLNDFLKDVYFSLIETTIKNNNTVLALTYLKKLFECLLFLEEWAEDSCVFVINHTYIYDQRFYNLIVLLLKQGGFIQAVHLLEFIRKKTKTFLVNYYNLLYLIRLPNNNLNNELQFSLIDQYLSAFKETGINVLDFGSLNFNDNNREYNLKIFKLICEHLIKNDSLIIFKMILQKPSNKQISSLIKVLNLNQNIIRIDIANIIQMNTKIESLNVNLVKELNNRCLGNKRRYYRKRNNLVNLFILILKL
jgi:hypothetical protein